MGFVLAVLGSFDLQKLKIILDFYSALCYN
nr:MAG TPA_asm: hypothetical protein [Caudoviricetes sp.]